MNKGGHSMGTIEEKQVENQVVSRAQRICKPSPKRLYSLDEAAFYLGRTTWSLRHLIWDGRLPIVRSGKRIFVDLQDLNSYVERNKSVYQ